VNDHSSFFEQRRRRLLLQAIADGADEPRRQLRHHDGQGRILVRGFAFLLTVLLTVAGLSVLYEFFF
jgi:hypothetical protein